MNAISVNGITVDYGDGKGVFNLSFSVKKGEVLGFLGPNGAGKTTTIRQLMGFARPGSGSCTISDLDCKTHAAEIQKHVGYLPGEIAFMDDMTGMQFIKFVAEMRGLRDLSRAHKLIEYFELNPGGKIKKMSKGMKQKIGIVCAFMHNPETLILDEPTSGLDPLMQSKFIDLIAEEKKKGTTILMSSHMFEEIERLCDRAIIIKAGRLMADEDIKSLGAKKRLGFVVTLKTDEMAEAFAEEPIEVESIKGTRVTVKLQGDIMPLIHAMGRYHVVGLEPISQKLEDLFMNFYGGAKND
ncbi:ABC transporter ATP-binding protein [Bacillus atrophaeus]|uniref:ABC transporter ATP-binding protein n=1 Tax=Bacillus atrophaeus TaxID=1452 RepID=UPI0021633901|nr:ABC transporter ATP-binding protein [Bacillus atrophaeus]